MKPTCILFLLLHATLTAVLAEAPSGKMQQLTSPDQVPEGLQKSDWQSIRGEYEKHRHAIVANADGTHQARNPGQAWLTKFDGLGFTVTPDAGGWTWGLELEGYGKVLEVRQDGGKASYLRENGLTEWFVNDARGLEQGWTLAKRPERAGASGPIRLDLSVRGSLRPRVSAAGDSLAFLNETGGTILTYGGLKAWDADGETVAARFAEEAVGEPFIAVLVDDRNARYPITIDPVAQQAYLKASNTEAYDAFGVSVAVSGDTVVVGASGESSSATGVNGNQVSNSAFQSGAAYVFVRNGSTWSQQAYLKASNTEEGDSFGVSVAVSGDTVVVGASYENSRATGVNGDQADNDARVSGAAYVFVRSGSIWSQQAYLKASNAERGDFFGSSVAVSGNTVVVGAYSESSSATGVNGNQADNSAGYSGAAYVFVRSGTTWNQQAYLKASNTEAYDFFGLRVAVSGDTVVVGASGESSSATGVNGNQADNSAPKSGSAYVFVRSGITWSQQAYIKASNTGAGDEFGNPVAVSGDTLVVGAVGEDSNATGVNGDQADNSALWSGAAYVFVRSGTTWGQQAYLKASNTEEGDWFGYPVAVSGDTVVVGASGEDSSATGVNGNQADNSVIDSGAAYVFVRSGSTWSQQDYLKASNTEERDWFGSLVAVSGDTVVVGVYGEDSSATKVNGNQADNSAEQSGAVYVFNVVVTYYSLVTFAENGVVDGAGPYQSGATATASATPNPGYAFTGWKGDATGADNPLSVLMDTNKSITADFGPDNSDDDNDGLTNYQEIVTYGTDPDLSDTDHDGMNDFQEIEAGRDPLKIETGLTLGSLSFTYDGSPKVATATSDVEGLTVDYLYNGSETIPVNAGSYTVIAAINDPVYTGKVTGTLVIEKATATVMLGNLAATYDGNGKSATATTTPSGLTVSITYNGSATVPTNAGSYSVVATVNDSNYTEGSDSGTLVIAKGLARVDLSNLSATYDGTPKPVTVATVPAGLPFSVTYAGQIQPHTHAGAYPVVVTINDSNYTGAASGELVIAKGNQTITFAPIPNQTPDETTVQLSASAGSGLQTVFSVVSGPASVSGNTLSIEGLGPIVVETSQAGDSNWNAANPVQRTFHVFSGTFGQDFVWAKGFGGSGSDTAYGIATDSAGNAYVASDFTGTVAFGAISLTASGSSSDLALLKVAADGNVLSATRFGGANFDYAKAVAVDTSDNVILAGEFMTSTVIGGTTLTSAGSKDISLLKVNSAGALQWSKRFGGTSSDSVYGLATDADGNILISGDFSGSITFGTTTLTSSGGRDGFLAKLNPSGTPLWAMKIGGTGNDTAYAVTVTASGQFVVGGSFSVTATFGIISRTSAGGTDGFAMGISSAGSVQWVTRFGGSSNDSGRAVAVDSTGSACVAGNFAGTDSNFGTEVLASEGLDDAFVVRLDVTNGAFLTVKQCGGAGADAGLGLAADPFGSLYLSGSYSGTAYFDGHTLITPQGADAFVAKLSVDGNFLWALTGGGGANDSATNIAVDRAGHVFAAGLFAQAARIGSHDVTGGGLVDLFVAKINGPTPSFVSTPGSVTVDVGDPFSIVAPAVGAEPITYQWFKGAVPLAGKTSTTLEVAAASTDDQGVYHVVATNFYGSTQLADVSVIVRVPDRVLTIDAPAASEENRTLEVPLYLDSAGEVTGLTVELAYDRDLLRNPSFDVGKDLSKQNSTVVVDTVAGTVRVVGTAYPSSIPAGRKLVGTLSFTTRSVPENAVAVFTPTLASISDQFGAPLGGYTKMVGDQTPIARRTIPGDANNNGRLDVSDAAELIRLYANPAQIRTWDNVLNDLNLDGVLTEGDATRVLRVVTKRDSTPSFPAAAPLAMFSMSALPDTDSSSVQMLESNIAEAPAAPAATISSSNSARLVLTRLTGADANKVLAQVYLDDVPAGQAGVSFQVDYPAAVLRIAGASSLTIPAGGLPAGITPTWNVEPGNNYAAQTGSISLAAAWGSGWMFTNGQAVAHIVFEINPATTGQVHFPVALAATEVGPYNAEGPSTPLTMAGQVVTFTRTYADWALATLDDAAADPGVDSDGDGMSNALEFAASTNPGDANSSLKTTAAAHTPEGFMLRWFAAYGVNYRVRWSGDLVTWDDLIPSYPGSGADAEVTDPDAPAGGRFYRVEVIATP
jgi:uncharacterized repeat protein (TIGR02543 family)